ncbi:sigma 54-interacting transcriptional regulator [Zhaonella formicivorans]|uniref:sigma 54-interacting transcriptional regulator n=1 Tax=Zhaonella formicivorans TaxID=2528593 RepID=UPI0010EB2E17|nr:sigma-54-dependent transcriptional regulator [Zhaonella formicivorans]
MTRKEKVLQKVKEYTMGLSLQDLAQDKPVGLDATNIGRMIGVSRNNVSKELAALTREGMLIRVKGKPVLYLEVKSLEMILGRKLQKEERNWPAISILIRQKQQVNNQPRRKGAQISALDGIIGGQGSLKKQIEQAKAAILYPPNGLHTFLVGPTGVGKTMIAEKMYQFAIETGRLNPNAPFVIFNCADYAENTQLLLSQLFGYVKGAFTGAEREKTGMIDNADQGVLLLDEVHRLPPEGQEMLFHILDKGIYRRLGETETTRKANVLIIAATTEDPQVRMLKTFTRRIPMVISLPPLKDRPLEERFRLVRKFFKDEAKRIKADIKIAPEALYSLLLYECPGNVGQLRGDIQLICAGAFLEFHLKKQSCLEIKYDSLPVYIREALLTDDYRKAVKEPLFKYNYELIISQEEEDLAAVNEFKEHLAEFYKDLCLNLKKIFNESLWKKCINERVLQDVGRLLHRFWEKVNPGTLAEILVSEQSSSKMLNAVTIAADLLQKQLKRPVGKRVVYGLCLHLYYYLEQSDDFLKYTFTFLQQLEYEVGERKVAAFFRRIISEELGREIPAPVEALIALFLKIDEHKLDLIDRPVGILVLAHGTSTASSILKTAHSMLQTEHGEALDMPLGLSIADFLEQACHKVRELNTGKGVLLLVDMGYLITFAEIITKKTGISTKAVEMISTSTVIEAITKSQLPSKTLEDLVRELEFVNPYKYFFTEVRRKNSASTSQVILVTCITGQGTAAKLANLLKSIETLKKQNIEVVAVNGSEKYLPEDNINVIAVVGTVDLKLPGVPFVPLEEIITGTGLKRISALVNAIPEQEFKIGEGFEEIVLSALDRFLEFMDPIKIFRMLDYATKYLEEDIQYKFSKNIYLRFMIHCGCMVERVLKGNMLAHKKHKRVLKVNETIYGSLKQSFRFLEESLAIQIPPEELAYIVELLLETETLSVSKPV